MGQKGHIMVQKGLKMHKKGQKIEFLDLKKGKKEDFFLSGIGGYPPPLNGKSLCPKKHSGMWVGGTPHLSRKYPLCSF